MRGLQCSTGIGLRAPHYQEMLHRRPDVGFLEIHPENYTGGGVHRLFLQHLKDVYPLSFHCVGLSLGSADGLDTAHLAAIKRLVDAFQPVFVSDHLSWSRHGDAAFPDLLPLPYTDESLDIFCQHIDQVQTTLQRQILIENPSTYLNFTHHTYSEPEFLTEMVRRTGCGWLCDLNNIYVNAHNHNLDVQDWLDHAPWDTAQEIHLAGHKTIEQDGIGLLIDDHGSAVCDAVWDLYAQVLRRGCRAATLIEWDSDIPPLDVLLAEQQKAVAIQHQYTVEAICA